MKNPTNNSEFMDDINADDQFIMHDAIEDAREERYEDLPIEFQSMDAFAPGVIDDWDMPPASDAHFWEHVHDDDVDPVAEGFHPGHE
tara:strand:+ start:918 stop:1178 length:261 start_codon:yes stop_codon:yes gene_type:complete